ncbi:MAG: hypothetical protein AAFO01_17545 [Pseudomonadota bacterium]
MIGFLTVLTVVVVLLIVVLVAYHLIGIYIALKRGADHLETLAGGLAKVRDDTGSLNAKVDTINGGLSALAPDLLKANENLAAIVNVAKQGQAGTAG